METRENVKVRVWSRDERKNRMWWALFVITLAITSIILAGKARAEEEKAEPVANITSEFLSKYVDENGAAYTSSAVLRSSALLNLFGGVWFEVWDSKTLRNSKSDEFDVTLGITREVLGLELEAGVSYVDLEQLLKSNQGDLWKGYVSGKKSFKLSETQTVAPFVKLQGYLPVRGNSAEEKGFHAFVGVEHSSSAVREVNFFQKAYVLYDDGALGYDKATIFAYEVGAEVKVYGPVSVLFSGKFTNPLGHVSDGRKTEIIPGAGLKLDF